MSSGQFVADAVSGQAQADALIRSLRCFANDPDALFKLLEKAIEPADHSRAKLRGVARGLQKFIERQIETAR